MPHTPISRRRFIQTASAAAAGGALLPSMLRAREAPGILTVRNPNAKIQLAVVGLGGISTGHLLAASEHEALVAICDVRQEAIDRGWARLKKEAQGYVEVTPARQYLDYRELLDDLGDRVDGVHICTPDHNHAVIAMDCIKRGKHVLVEKPMAHNITEAFALREAARAHRVATQMGNQGHMSEGIRRGVEILHAQALGPVTEVYHWCGRTFGGADDGLRSTMRDTLDPAFRLWSVPAAESVARLSVETSGYSGHPLGRPQGGWRGDRRWGTGNLGDWGCHTIDPGYWGLKVYEAPHFEVECLSQRFGGAFHFHKTNAIRWRLPERAGMPPCEVYWYDGRLPNDDPTILDEEGKPAESIQNLPARVVEIYKQKGSPPPEFGSLFIGERGCLMMGGHASYGGLFPLELNQEIRLTEQTLPDPTGNKYTAWYHAIRTGEPAAAGFDYSAGLTEFVLTGVLAETAGPGKALAYDRTKHRVTNDEEINRLLTRDYREGYAVEA